MKMSLFSQTRAALWSRLIFVPSGLLALGIISAIAVTLLGAPKRIASEINSGVSLGALVIEYALDNIDASQDPDSALRKLRQELSKVRHINVDYVGEQKNAALDPHNKFYDNGAPSWFLALFEPERPAKFFSVRIRGEPHGELVMTTRPADEVGEIWGDLVFLTTLLSSIAAATVALIAASARRTLKPLNDLFNGLGRLQHGRFDGLDEIRVVELRQIGQQFNSLARKLARMDADNRLLINRLMSVQEAERKELARELHDEFGAALFGIRAAAACIIEDASSNGSDERTRGIIARAQSISSLTELIQKHNYRILERVRPVILYQLGLFNGIQDLVDRWRRDNRDVRCNVLFLPPEQPDLPEDVTLTCYRIVQECLTNVARHARARNASIAIKITPIEGGAALAALANDCALCVKVEDDGVGVRSDLRFGFGLLGMTERVHALGGKLSVGNGATAGTVIEAIIPLVNKASRSTCAIQGNCRK